MERLDDGEYMFVLKKGHFYARPERSDPSERFHHFTFLANGRVDGAGTWLIEEGRLTRVTNHSGSYRAGAGPLKRVVRWLRSYGIGLDTLTVTCTVEVEIRLGYPSRTETFEMPATHFLWWLPPRMKGLFF